MTSREGGGIPPDGCGRLRHNAFDKTTISGEMSFANMETSIRHIPTRTRRQVMDWSLVLASQDIETTIEKDEAGWCLCVAEADYERARSAIDLYRRENRGWLWRQRFTQAELPFHWASLFWIFGLLLFNLCVEIYPGDATGRGIMNSARVAAGEWWRLFTAVTLHADGGHLLANLTTGFLFFGFAMSAYGPGICLLASYVAGAGANLAGYWIYPMTHRGLGASGMVMAALGLLAVQSARLWRRHPKATKLLLRMAAGGFLILVFFGFSPETDVVAHVAGFFIGAVLGISLAWVKEEKLRGVWPNAVSAGLLVTLVALTWRLALGRN